MNQFYLDTCLRWIDNTLKYSSAMWKEGRKSTIWFHMAVTECSKQNIPYSKPKITCSHSHFKKSLNFIEYCGIMFSKDKEIWWRDEIKFHEKYQNTERSNLSDILQYFWVTDG